MNRRIALVLVLVAAILGLVALQRPGVPELPAAPALPDAPMASAPAATQGPLAASDDDATPPSRVRGILPTPAGRADVELVVGLEQQVGTTRTILPGVEIGLHSGGTTLVAHTGPDGMATFSCVGGDGQPATVRCVLGAEVQIVLDAQQTQPLVLVVRPRVRVRGTVTDLAGNRVAQAAIVLLPWSGLGDDSPAPRRIGQTLADGSYEVDLGVGGRLGAQQRGYAASAMHLVQAPATGAEPLPIVTLPLVLAASAGTIQGIVRDHRGQPVPHADLEFRSAGRVPMGAELAAVPQRVRSNADGSFLVARLAPGPITWGARARGHGPARGSVRLLAGQAQTLVVDLTPGCVLEGTVHHADGTPCVASLVAGDPQQFPPHRVTSAADGSYRFVDLAPGATPVAATARAPGGGRAGTATTTIELQPEAAAVWHAVIAAPGPAGNLRGRLVDAQGRPLAGWRIVAVPAGSMPMQGRSDERGAFALATPPDRPVDLRAYPGGNPATQWAAAVRRGVLPQGEVEFRVESPEPGRLVGRVVAADLGGVPARLGCWHHERAEYVTLAAREDGLLQLDMPPGTVDIVFEHPGHASAVRRELAVHARSHVDVGEVTLGVGGVLFGQVRGPDGNAPDDCQLVVLRQDAGDVQRFEGRYVGGAYRFPTLPAGDHVLLVQGAGLAATSETITIRAAAEVRHDIDLAAGISRRIVVVLPPGAPSSCVLAFRAADGPLRWLTTGGVQADTTNERRIHFMACLPAGRYHAVAWAGADHRCEAPVAFTADADAEVELTLRPR